MPRSHKYKSKKKKYLKLRKTLKDFYRNKKMNENCTTEHSFFRQYESNASTENHEMICEPSSQLNLMSEVQYHFYPSGFCPSKFRCGTRSVQHPESYKFAMSTNMKRINNNETRKRKRCQSDEGSEDVDNPEEIQEPEVLDINSDTESDIEVQEPEVLLDTASDSETRAQVHTPVVFQEDSNSGPEIIQEARKMSGKKSPEMERRITRNQLKNMTKTRSQKSLEATQLILECYEEELSEAQILAQDAAEKDYQQALKKIDDMMQSHSIIYKGPDVMVLQNGSIDGHVASVLQKSTPNILNKTTTSTILSTPANIVRTTNATQRLGQQTTYQLVMNPSLGNNVGFLVTSSTAAKTPVIQSNAAVAKTSTPLQISTSINRPQMHTRVGNQIAPTIKLAPQSKAPIGKVPIPSINAITNVAPLTLGLTPIQSSVSKPPILATKTAILAAKPPHATPAAKTTATNSSGGVPTVDLTANDEDQTADSREILFNKLSGKTFPSLVVLARPNLRMKDNTQNTNTKEKAAMDAKVKAVLIHTPTKFTEWLIQQGLVRSEQCCVLHFGADQKPLKLKLGMYSDASKFPYSGGYVWISECCPQRFVSVFSGSIFEGAPHPPTILLKLIYHWACQTSVNNVVQWVKVDNFYVKNFFTHLRAICTAAVHTKMGLLGGLNRFVEVGVISLGTTSQDGQQRQVKVEVLGVLDKEAKLVRLRAIEPMQEGDRNLKRRFAKILEPLVHWVHPGSTILTDFSIDKATLQCFGFSNVFQTNATDGGVLLNGKLYSNQNVMEYLRKIVPRMFLNTLSLLNRSLIQQFLDELTWRECWGPHPPQAFDSILIHIAEQTKVELNDPLVKRLNNISINPFKNWNYLELSRSVQARLSSSPGQSEFSSEFAPQSLCEVQYAPGPASSKRPRKSDSSQPTTAVKRIKLNTNDQTYLDSYYYGDIQGLQVSVIEDMDCEFSVKCILCTSTFLNNIALMKHIINHVVFECSDQSNKRITSYCMYCLKKMQTSMQLAAHKAECHQNSTAVMACSICQLRFSTRQILVKHMHIKHNASELPFKCGVCTYRTSFHYKAVDHFYETHTGGSSLQCPICLKIFYASGLRCRGNYINLTGFYHHLMGHKRQSLKRKCERCCLVFQHTKHAVDHEESDHKSLRNYPKLQPVVSTEASPTIIIPLPKGGALPLASPSKQVTTSGATRTFTLVPLESKILAPASANCVECNQPLLQLNHLVNLLNCLRCRYVTCCSNAMNDHCKKFHSNLQHKLNLPKERTLADPLFCICGFKSNKGNVLATHLAKCEKRSAYPKPSIEAQSASFPPLVTLDDGPAQDPNHQMMKAYVNKKNDKSNAPGTSGGSMLNVLGLVRKSSTEDDSAPQRKKSKKETKTAENVTDDEKEEVEFIDDVIESSEVDIKDEEESKTVEID